MDYLEGYQGFREYALKDVVPARPAIKQAALEEKGVDEHRERRGPAREPDPIDTAKRIAIGCQKIFHFLKGIAPL